MRRTSTRVLGVERGERLVEEQRTRLDRQRAGEGDPLGLAAGELVGFRVRRVFQPELREQLPGASVGGGLPHSTRVRAERDVVERVEMPEEQTVLEHDRDRAVFGRHEDPGARVVEHHAFEPDRAGVDRREPRDRVEHRALTRAVGPDEHYQLVGVELELDGEVQRSELEVDAGRQRGPAGHHRIGELGHAEAAPMGRAPNTRRPTNASTRIDTASNTRLSTIAVPGSFSSAR